jgi:hypothetical protein
VKRGETGSYEVTAVGGEEVLFVYDRLATLNEGTVAP